MKLHKLGSSSKGRGEEDRLDPKPNPVGIKFQARRYYFRQHDFICLCPSSSSSKSNPLLGISSLLRIIDFWEKFCASLRLSWLGFPPYFLPSKLLNYEVGFQEQTGQSGDRKYHHLTARYVLHVLTMSNRLGNFRLPNFEVNYFPLLIQANFGKKVP